MTEVVETPATQKPKKPKKLTRRQRAFVEAYLTYWDAQRAALAAGYSPAMARGKSYKMVQLPIIQERINARLKELQISADEVLTRLGQQATASIGEFLYEQRITNPKTGVVHTRTMINWDAVAAKGHLVKRIEATRDGFRLELHDSQNALVQLGRAHRLFIDRGELSGPNGGPLSWKEFIESEGDPDVE